MLDATMAMTDIVANFTDEHPRRGVRGSASSRRSRRRRSPGAPGRARAPLREARRDHRQPRLDGDERFAPRRRGALRDRVRPGVEDGPPTRPREAVAILSARDGCRRVELQRARSPTTITLARHCPGGLIPTRDRRFAPGNPIRMTNLRAPRPAFSGWASTPTRCCRGARPTRLARDPRAAIA